jgi:hypothetical protein
LSVRIRNVMAGSPVNPTHQFGEVLVRRFDFPFIKAELLVVNPSNIAIAVIAHVPRFCGRCAAN